MKSEKLNRGRPAKRALLGALTRVVAQRARHDLFPTPSRVSKERPQITSPVLQVKLWELALLIYKKMEVEKKHIYLRLRRRGDLERLRLSMACKKTTLIIIIMIMITSTTTTENLFARDREDLEKYVEHLRSWDFS